MPDPRGVGVLAGELLRPQVRVPRREALDVSAESEKEPAKAGLALAFLPERSE